MLTENMLREALNALRNNDEGIRLPRENFFREFLALWKEAGGTKMGFTKDGPLDADQILRSLTHKRTMISLANTTGVLRLAHIMTNRLPLKRSSCVEIFKYCFEHWDKSNETFDSNSDSATSAQLLAHWLFDDKEKIFVVPMPLEYEIFSSVQVDSWRISSITNESEEVRAEIKHSDLWIRRDLLFRVHINSISAPDELPYLVFSGDVLLDELVIGRFKVLKNKGEEIKLVLYKIKQPKTPRED